MHSKKSSFSIFVRAVTMLIFVAGISWFAVNGTAGLDKCRKQFDAYWPKVSEVISTVKEKFASETASKDKNSTNSSTNIANNQPENAGRLGQITTENKAVLLSAPSPGMSIERLPALANSQDVMPVSFQSTNGTATTQPGLESRKQTNPFLEIQDRLRQLGATYYLLETWGNQQQLFRFYCQMSVGGSESYTRYFEATNSDPMAAMADVLKQVETWRSGTEKAH